MFLNQQSPRTPDGLSKKNKCMALLGGLNGTGSNFKWSCRIYMVSLGWMEVVRWVFQQVNMNTFVSMIRIEIYLECRVRSQYCGSYVTKWPKRHLPIYERDTCTYVKWTLRVEVYVLHSAQSLTPAFFATALWTASSYMIFCTSI